MAGKLLKWLKARPTFFGQKNYPTGKTPKAWDIRKPLATIPAVESLLSGPSKTVLAEKYPKKIVENFLTRFRGQKGKGFFGNILRQR